MIFLVLAVLCSVSIGMIFKVAGRDDLDRTALLTINYAAAVGVAATLISLGGRDASVSLNLSLPLVVLSVGTGALLIFGFFMLSLSTDVAGMGLSIGVMRVSVVIPFLASWLIWSEEPNTAQLAGMGCAAVAFFLLARTEEQDGARGRIVDGEGEEHETRQRGEGALRAYSSQADARTVIGPAERKATTKAGSDAAIDAATDASTDASANVPGDVHVPQPSAKVLFTLFILFLSGGAVDITMKTFQESFGATNSRFMFLLLSFGIAFLIGLGYVVQKGVRTGEWPDRATWAWGTLLGVINYGSLEFLLRALEVLPGTVVFPINNIAIVVLAAGLGVAFWNERLSRGNVGGLGLALLGLLLLNL